MTRTLKLYARQLTRLVLVTGTPRPRATVETEDGKVRSLDGVAIETVRRLVGRKKAGVFSPLDGCEAQAILSAVEANGYVGDIFEVRLRGLSILFVVQDDGLAFLA